MTRKELTVDSPGSSCPPAVLLSDLGFAAHKHRGQRRRDADKTCNLREEAQARVAA